MFIQYINILPPGRRSETLHSRPRPWAVIYRVTNLRLRPKNNQNQVGPAPIICSFKPPSTANHTTPPFGAGQHLLGDQGWNKMRIMSPRLAASQLFIAINENYCCYQNLQVAWSFVQVRFQITAFQTKTINWGADWIDDSG